MKMKKKILMALSALVTFLLVSQTGFAVQWDKYKGTELNIMSVTQAYQTGLVELKSEFEKKTGIGVLLNTSFNIQEPIVENPSQAIDCFLRSSVDILAIGPYLCDSEWRKKVTRISNE